MNLRMGSQSFFDVQIPLLWGSRAVVQDRKGTLSVIDLAGPTARLEILGDQPAPGVEFAPEEDGFVIRSSGQELYSYSPKEKALTPITLDLLPVRITDSGTWVGSNFFGGNVIGGFGVGLQVLDGGGLAMGAPLPPGLAKLRV